MLSKWKEKLTISIGLLITEHERVSVESGILKKESFPKGERIVYSSISKQINEKFNLIISQSNTYGQRS